MNSNEQYFNDAQQFLLAMNARDEIAVCGRGFGKGAVQAGRLQTGFQGMPGSAGGFVSPSVKRCLTNILPSLLIHLERWGFRRDVHYCVGKKPWKALHWHSPIFAPANWENSIAFYNGSVCNIISQDRAGTSNSMSLDYIIADEAKFLDPDQLRNETFLANRGNEMYFGDFFMHHGMTITSDMPITKKGSWFLKYEEDMNVDLVSSMWFICRKIAALHKQIMSYPDKAYVINEELNQWRSVLNKMRKDCLLYAEFSSLENIDLLGEDYIRRMKRELSPGTFDSAILNKRQRIAKDGFYGSLDEDVNFYTAPNISYLDNMAYDFNKLQQVDSRMDSDVDDDLPLVIAFDANSNFNCLVVGQDKDAKLRVLKSFYVKYDRKLPELIDDFCLYYHYHKFKKVLFYFDATFKGTVTGMHANELYVIIERALKRNGWAVQTKYIGKPMNHIEKNLLINNMLKGRARHQVLINRDNNEDLIISIESAEVVNGKKDKSGEKVVETDEDQLQNRTDFSDAFDTLCIGVEDFPTFMGRTGAPNYYPGS
jgi:hypothetical protein